jgi:hypothetical protein
MGGRNKITIKDMIEICAKHAHVKKCKKRNYGLDARNSVRNESKNLEDISETLWFFVFHIQDNG